MTDYNNDEFLEWLRQKESEKNNDINSTEKAKDETSPIESTRESYNFEDRGSNSNFENRKIYTEENSDKIYVDKAYVDEQIKRNKPKNRFVKALSLVVVGAMLGSFLGPLLQDTIFPNQEIERGALSNESVEISVSEESNIENAVAKKAIPSVVGINTSYVSSNPLFFGMEQYEEGIGSGVIVHKDGYILTNAHVVGDNPDEINVLFSDKSNEPAQIVYIDETLDLAVIKVNKTNLPAIEFADSDKVSIGDKAIAIGNPLGFNLQSTLTSGYLSGLDRTITMEDGSVMTGLIQTDASINSGNSGGALLNSKGQLIGINTAKAGSTDGIGFAIPSNITKNIVDQIIQNGSFTPIVLGIRGVDLSIFKQYTNNLDIDADEGVYVAEVMPDTSAEDAGLQEGDVLLEIAGERVDSMNKLKQILIKFRVNDQSTLKVLRDGNELDLDISFRGQNPNI